MGSSLELRVTIWQQRICCDLESGMITLTLTLLSFFLVLVQARLDTTGHEPLTFSNDYFHLPDLFDNLFDIEQDQNNGGDLLFPTLNKEQQRFAVNPAYPGYTARVFGNPTDPLDEIDIEANDEVVKDPFFSSTGQDLKKASLNPLVQDPRVLANAIEDKIYGKDTSPSSGDRKLAQNAQLYHYQHTKQQMIAFDTNDKERARNGGNISDSEDEGEEGDYTVYECPGLAPTGEMEVRNPMFEDDQTPKASK